MTFLISIQSGFKNVHNTGTALLKVCVAVILVNGSGCFVMTVLFDLMADFDSLDWGYNVLLK